MLIIFEYFLLLVKYVVTNIYIFVLTNLFFTRGDKVFVFICIHYFNRFLIFSILLRCLPAKNSVSKNTLTVSKASCFSIKRAGKAMIFASLCSLANTARAFCQHKAQRTFKYLFAVI